jgi:hypothetical protein
VWGAAHLTPPPPPTTTCARTAPGTQPVRTSARACDAGEAGS